MESKDLRIGNIVSINGVELLLTSELFCLIVSGDVIKPKPIPLTEEWLIKAGFVKIADFNGYNNCYMKDGFVISLSKGECINIHLDWVYDGEVENLPSIKCYEEIHVHELQNDFKTLTGEELTFEEHGK